jgi:hypothetical protein
VWNILGALGRDSLTLLGDLGVFEGDSAVFTGDALVEAGGVPLVNDPSIRGDEAFNGDASRDGAGASSLMLTVLAAVVETPAVASTLPDASSSVGHGGGATISPVSASRLTPAGSRCTNEWLRFDCGSVVWSPIRSAAHRRTVPSIGSRGA